jgi:hypothetical protein
MEGASSLYLRHVSRTCWRRGTGVSKRIVGSPRSFYSGSRRATSAPRADAMESYHLLEAVECVEVRSTVESKAALGL